MRSGFFRCCIAKTSSSKWSFIANKLKSTLHSKHAQRTAFHSGKAAPHTWEHWAGAAEMLVAAHGNVQITNTGTKDAICDNKSAEMGKMRKRKRMMIDGRLYWSKKKCRFVSKACSDKCITLTFCCPQSHVGIQASFTYWFSTHRTYRDNLYLALFCSCCARGPYLLWSETIEVYLFQRKGFVPQLSITNLENQNAFFTGSAKETAVPFI